jgi:hypothetical protein
VYVSSLPGIRLDNSFVLWGIVVTSFSSGIEKVIGCAIIYVYGFLFADSTDIVAQGVVSGMLAKVGCRF